MQRRAAWPAASLLAITVVPAIGGPPGPAEPAFRFAILGDPTGSAQPGIYEEAWREAAVELTSLFARKRGETEVRLRLEKPRDFSVVMDVPARVRSDKEFKAEVERICGPEALEILAT